MPYRDHAPTCPRCRTGLIRDDADREAWHCARCGGTALGVGDLIDDLLEAAPHLRPATGARELVTISRRATPEVACPLCSQAMEPVYLAALETNRCRHDQILWMSRGERDTIIARAAVQPISRPFDHLRVVFLGQEAPRETSRTSIAAGAVGFVAMVAAFPIGLLGLRTLRVTDSFAPWLVLLAAAIMLIAGASVFVRAIDSHG
jgi:Zn-finger nucleic acid-binding protein